MNILHNRIHWCRLLCTHHGAYLAVALGIKPIQPQNPCYMIAHICNGLHALYSKDFIILPPSTFPLRGNPDRHP